MPEIQKMVVISTAHLSQDAQRYLDSEPCVFPKRDYGWFAYATRDLDDDAPAELPVIFAWANNLDVEWIMFDCDGEVEPDLPRFERHDVGASVRGLVAAIGGTGETGEEVTLEAGWRGVVDMVDDSGYHVSILCPGRPDPDDTIVNVFGFDEAAACFQVVNEPSPFETSMIDPPALEA